MDALDPPRPSLRSDTSPKGRGKGAYRTDGFAKAQGFPSGGKLSPKVTDEGKTCGF